MTANGQDKSYQFNSGLTIAVDERFPVQELEDPGRGQDGLVVVWSKCRGLANHHRSKDQGLSDPEIKSSFNGWHLLLTGSQFTTLEGQLPSR